MTKPYILKFGKYRGCDIENVPREYVEWLIDTYSKEVNRFKAELERRDSFEEENLSLAEKILQVGFRSLAKTMHPDVGGSDKEMRELNATYEGLRERIKYLYGD